MQFFVVIDKADIKAHREKYYSQKKMQLTIKDCIFQSKRSIKKYQQGRKK